jgi:hypothetical protein
MNDTRQALISAAISQARRVRRTTGRLVVSGLGFGLAYYFDVENGSARREHLRRTLRRTAVTIDSVLAPEVVDPPPVFTPLLRSLAAEDYETEPARRFEAN